MKSRDLLVWLACLPLVLNWSQNSSVEGTTKHKVNFYGTVETIGGRTFEVENISIARLFKNIPVYEVPNQVGKNLQLTQDPRKGIITKLDLAEVTSIEVPYPKQLWKYKQKRGGRTIEFIEITVVSKDPQQTTHNYLIQTNRKLLCDQKNEAGPIEKVIPLTALKRLTIDGYTYRDQEDKNRVKGS